MVAMSIDPAIFRALVAQGATPEMLLAVVEADAAVREQKAEKKRADTAARVRKHRAGKSGNDRNALQSVTERYEEPALPPNDIYSNPPTNPSEAKASESPFAEKVVLAWNDGPAANGAQRANPLTPKRRKHLVSRVREVGEDGLLAAIRGIAGSDWHCGTGSNGWRADLGWLLENAERVAKFAERSSSAKPTAPAMTSDAQAAYLAKLNSAPHLRGVSTTDAPRNNGTASGPRPFAQLAGGIASGLAH